MQMQSISVVSVPRQPGPQMDRKTEATRPGSFQVRRKALRQDVLALSKQGMKKKSFHSLKNREGIK